MMTTHYLLNHGNNYRNRACACPSERLIKQALFVVSTLTDHLIKQFAIFFLLNQ